MNQETKESWPASRGRFVTAALKGAFWGAGSATALAAMVTGLMWAAASSTGASIHPATAAAKAAELTVMLLIGALPLGGALGLAASTWKKEQTHGKRPRRNAPPG